MLEEIENVSVDKMTNAIVSFLDFLKKFRQITRDEIISDEKLSISYSFRKFNLECYIIDKKYFDDFCSRIHYNEISKILTKINEETKNKCKDLLRKILEEKNYIPDFKNIIFYSSEESMKQIVKQFNNYSFLNKELLVDCMGVPEENLKSQTILLSKNENNFSLFNANENFMLTINVIKKNQIKETDEKKEEKKEEKNNKIQKIKKNIYYVEDITKRIFTLLYKKDEFFNKKIKKKAVDPYGFKNYYLINKDWLKDYKEYFLYNDIINKFKKKLENYPYKRIKAELDDIIKNEIGQIKLYSRSEAPNNVKNSYKLIPELKLIKLNNPNEEFEEELETKEPEQDIDSSYNIPHHFEIVNEEIFEMIKKEEFLEKYDEEIEKQLCYQVLFGNKNIIIKNKLNQKFEEKNNYSNELLFYEINKDDLYDDDNLKYIINFEKKVNFYEEIGNIVNKGLGNYLFNRDINLGEKLSKEIIVGENKNVLGKFININIDPNSLKNVDDNEEDNIDIGENYVENDMININNEDDIKINDIKKSQNINKNDNNILEYPNFDDDYDYNKNEINIINDNKNEILINENKNEINLNGNKILKDKKEYKIEEIKKRIEIIKNTLFNIDDNLINKTDMNDINNIDKFELNSKDLEKKLAKAYNIVLMNEDQYRDYKSQFNFEEFKKIMSKYDSMKEIKDKDDYLEEKKFSLIKYFDYFKNDKKLIIPSDKVKLIANFRNCIENINYNKKFFILSQQFIKTKEKYLIYYFQFSGKTYIYFKEDKKIFKIKNINKENNLFELDLFEEKNKDKNDYLKEFKNIVQKNNRSEFLKEQNSKLFDCYLINNKWYDSVQNEGIKAGEYKKYENFKPKYENGGAGNKHPVEFNLVFKDKQSESIIDNLKNSFNIKDDIVISEIFITKEKTQNNNKENTYICMINDNFIFFYLLQNANYNFKFFIKYNDMKIVKTEKDKRILYESFKSYINFMIISNNKLFKLYDIDFKEIGMIYYLKNEDFTMLERRRRPYVIKLDKEYKIYEKKIQPLLLCLANIIEFKDFMSSIPNKIKNENDNKFLINFFQILRIMWFCDTKFTKIISKDYYNIFVELLFRIGDNSSKNKINTIIYDNMKILLEKIILNLQKDLYKIENNKDFIYQDKVSVNEDKLKNSKEKRTFLQDLFFFNIEYNQKFKSQQEAETGLYQQYYLELKINEEDKKSMDISSLFENLNDYNEEYTITWKFISLPKYLIIIINNNKNRNFKCLPEIYIENFCKNIKKAKYELISFIDKNSIAFCKSPIDLIWRKYDENDENKVQRIKKIEEEIGIKNGSNFLIYKANLNK